MNLALIAGLLLAYSGMLGLCLGLERYYKQLRRPLPTKTLLRVLRSAGWLALVASFASCVWVWGWAMGPVAWFALISLAGLALIFMLPYTPQLAIVVAGVSWPLLGIGLLTLTPPWS